MKYICSLVIALTLAGCSGDTAYAPRPADTFMARLALHCGRAYEGKVVSTDPADAGFSRQRLVMQVRTCTGPEFRVPFHVGEDRSRTWVITRTKNGLRLKHDHRHKDGGPDAVTPYGGDSDDLFSPERVEFPADQYSIDLFTREGLAASVTNVWALEITEEMFAYELSRENRFFRVEFDLTHPVDPPPPPWGAKT